MGESNTPDETDESKTKREGKVAKVIHEYGLDGLGDELVEYWTGVATDRMGLRELADYFNEELLIHTLRDASVNTLDGEPANFYRLLTDDNVSSGTSVQATNQLEQRGIDVDRLTTEFVSRQAIHTYLTKYRGVNYSVTDDDPVEKETTNTQRLKRRMTTMVESKVERLRDADRITLGNSTS